MPILVAPNAIIMPVGRILLVKKDAAYGAIKFLKFWTGKSEEDRYAEYESFYMPAIENNVLSSERTVFKRKKLSSPKPRGIGRFAFSLGNKELECGPIKLFWSGKGSVYFYRLNQNEGDYGIELAPTNWSDILDVNLSDPRIQWYKFDLDRERKVILIDKIWE